MWSEDEELINKVNRRADELQSQPAEVWDKVVGQFEKSFRGILPPVDS